jgi:hypothetical protein
MAKWIEINSEKDLPNKKQFCWWVNRSNGNIFPDKMERMLGQSMTHLTFSHYMPIGTIPKAPAKRKQLTDDYSAGNFSFDLKTKKHILLDKKGKKIKKENQYK